MVLYRQCARRFPNTLLGVPKPKPLPEHVQDMPPQRTSCVCRAQPAPLSPTQTHSPPMPEMPTSPSGTDLIASAPALPVNSSPMQSASQNIVLSSLLPSLLTPQVSEVEVLSPPVQKPIRKVSPPPALNRLSSAPQQSPISTDHQALLSPPCAVSLPPVRKQTPPTPPPPTPVYKVLSPSVQSHPISVPPLSPPGLTSTPATNRTFLCICHEPLLSPSPSPTSPVHQSPTSPIQSRLCSVLPSPVQSCLS